MDLFADYKTKTRSEAEPGKCGECANAIWRVLHADAPDAYDAAKNCSIACHCTALGRPITHIVYDCSAYAASDAAQADELAGII